MSMTPTQIQNWAAKFATLTRGLFLTDDDIKVAAVARDNGMSPKKAADLILDRHGLLTHA